MNDLNTFLSDNGQDLFMGQCPFCSTSKASLFAKSSENKYKCFTCGIKGDLVSLKRIVNRKISDQSSA